MCLQCRTLHQRAHGPRMTGPAHGDAKYLREKAGRFPRPSETHRARRSPLRLVNGTFIIKGRSADEDGKGELLARCGWLGKMAKEALNLCMGYTRAKGFFFFFFFFCSPKRCFEIFESKIIGFGWPCTLASERRSVGGSGDKRTMLALFAQLERLRVWCTEH